jgi:hypothetical protein
MSRHAASAAVGQGPEATGTRASRARRRLLVSLVPVVLLGVARAAYSAHDLGVLVAAACFLVPVGLLEVALGVCSVVYQRGMRKLAATAGPGAWAAVCTDVRRPELWRALVADTGGVQLVGDRRGTVVAAWSWSDIDAVTVEKATVGERNGHAVVLHLRDCSNTSLAFLVIWALGFPRRRAQAVAGELERRRAHAAAAPGPADPLPTVPADRSPASDRPVPTPLPGLAAGRLQFRGYLLAYGTVLALLPTIAFEHYLPGGTATELRTFIPVGVLCFALGYTVVFRGMRKARREVGLGYTTINQTADWDQALFLFDWRDLSLLARPFQPRPDKLPRRKRAMTT